MELLDFLAIGQLVVRFAVATLLISAAVAKYRDYPKWIGALSAYGLLPEALLGAFALSLPAAELIVALSLVFGVLLFAGILAGIGLLILFASALAINLLRGRRNIDCGCDLRGRPRQISWYQVGRNAMLAGALFACLLRTPSVDVSEHAIALIAALALFGLFRTLSYIQSFAPAKATYGA